MANHQITVEPDWFNDRYHNEEADDGSANELSFYPQPDKKHLELLLTNTDFDGHNHDNTFILNQRDVRRLNSFLQDWLKRA